MHAAIGLAVLVPLLVIGGCRRAPPTPSEAATETPAPSEVTGAVPGPESPSPTVEPPVEPPQEPTSEREDPLVTAARARLAPVLARRLASLEASASGADVNDADAIRAFGPCERPDEAARETLSQRVEGWLQKRLKVPDAEVSQLRFDCVEEDGGVVIDAVARWYDQGTSEDRVAAWVLRARPRAIDAIHSVRGEERDLPSLATLALVPFAGVKGRQPVMVASRLGGGFELGSHDRYATEVFVPDGVRVRRVGSLRGSGGAGVSVASFSGADAAPPSSGALVLRLDSTAATFMDEPGRFRCITGAAAWTDCEAAQAHFRVAMAEVLLSPEAELTRVTAGRAIELLDVEPTERESLLEGLPRSTACEVLDLHGWHQRVTSALVDLIDPASTSALGHASEQALTTLAAQLQVERCQGATPRTNAMLQASRGPFPLDLAKLSASVPACRDATCRVTKVQKTPAIEQRCDAGDAVTWIGRFDLIVEVDGKDLEVFRTVLVHTTSLGAKLLVDTYGTGRRDEIGSHGESEVLTSPYLVGKFHLAGGQTGQVRQVRQTPQIVGLVAEAGSVEMIGVAGDSVWRIPSLFPTDETAAKRMAAHTGAEEGGAVAEDDAPGGDYPEPRACEVNPALWVGDEDLGYSLDMFAPDTNPWSWPWLGPGLEHPVHLDGSPLVRVLGCLPDGQTPYLRFAFAGREGPVLAASFVMPQGVGDTTVVAGPDGLGRFPELAATLHLNERRLLAAESPADCLAKLELLAAPSWLIEAARASMGETRADP